MSTTPDALVDRYLRDLSEALRGIPDTRRRELVDEVSEHIAAARAELDVQTEVGVRTVLARLGDPSDIAEEAHERLGIPRSTRRTPWLEVIALVLLVIPLIGWIPAAVIVGLSPSWSRRDKIIGVALVPAGWLVTFALSLLTPASGADAGVGSIGPLETTVLVLPLLSAVYLAVRLFSPAGAGRTAT